MKLLIRDIICIMSDFGIRGFSRGKIPTSLLTHFLSINRAKKLAARLTVKTNLCDETNSEDKSL